MFSPVWTVEATKTYEGLKAKAEDSLKTRQKSKKKKAAKDEGLFKQVHKCVTLLLDNPKHPSLVE